MTRQRHWSETGTYIALAALSLLLTYHILLAHLRGTL